MADGNCSRPMTSRRKLITTSLGSGILGIGFTSLISRANRGENWPVAVRRGSYTSPISMQEIQEANTQSRDGVDQRISNDVNSPTSRIESSQSNIVGYAVTHREDGSKQHYTVTAQDENSVRIAHERLAATVNKYQKKNFSSNIHSEYRDSENNVRETTDIPNQISDEWDFYDHGQWDEVGSLGVLTSNYDIGRVSSSGDDAYTLTHVYGAEPLDDNIVGDGNITHDWSVAEAPDAELHNYGPGSFGQNNTITVSAGVSSAERDISAGVSWSYQPGLTGWDNSSYASNIAEWPVDYQEDLPSCGHHGTVSAEFASSTVMTQPVAGSGIQDLVNLEASHSFPQTACNVGAIEDLNWTWYLSTVDY